MIEEAVTDERLLLAARTDPEAFTQFYRRHATVLLGYLVRRTGDAELGANLTAETFACARRSAAGAHGRAVRGARLDDGRSGDRVGSRRL